MPMTIEELREATRWTTEERAAFVKRFPRLHHWPDGRARTYFTTCGRGWIPLLERVFVLAEADERAIIGQIKEKYGGLRIYLEHDSVDPELLRVIDEVEEQSEAVCEACGEPARTAESARGWIMTLCEAHLTDGARFLPPEIPDLSSSEDDDGETGGLRREDTDHLVTGTVNASTRESVTANEIATWIRDENVSLPRARVAVATFFLEVPLATQIAFLEHHGIDEAKALAFAERNEPLGRPLPLQSRKRW